MPVVGLFSPSYKYLKHGADQLDNKSFVSRRLFFFLMLNSHFFFLREKRMRYKARFPEVFFCRRDYLECLFLLSCLLPPPSGFCHRWPAWPWQWGQARAQVWGNRGLRASWEPWGVGGWQRRRLCRWDKVPGRCSALDPATSSLRPATNLGEASALRNGKLNCKFWGIYLRPCLLTSKPVQGLQLL